ASVACPHSIRGGVHNTGREARGTERRSHALSARPSVHLYDVAPGESATSSVEELLEPTGALRSAPERSTLPTGCRKSLFDGCPSIWQRGQNWHGQCTLRDEGNERARLSGLRLRPRLERGEEPRSQDL